MSVPSAQKISVLIVEDDKFTSELLKFLLEREHYAVEQARDGLEARTFINSQEAPTVVVLDVMLPFIGGFELLQMMRTKTGWESTRIIMLSAKSEGQDIARAFDLGADDYLVKPFKPEELYARLRRFSRK